MKNRSVVVFGPAYLDRVLRVDRPLIESGQGPPIDQSVEGQWKFASAGPIELVDPGGFTIELMPPGEWPGPWGEFRLRRPLRAGLRGRRTVKGIAWQDDLGGMGAGYAAALGGRLYSATGRRGRPDQPRDRRVAGPVQSRVPGTARARSPGGLDASGNERRVWR